MAYNISNWTTKRIEGLVIPLAALCELGKDLIRRDWQPVGPIISSAVTEAGFLVEIRCAAEDSGISGELRLNKSIAVIAVTAIRLRGEGSGTFFWEVLVPALEQSKGELEAVLIWEGGDSISRLVVKDGVVTEPKVEL